MKRSTRFLGAFLCFVFFCACILPVAVSAAKIPAISTEHASEGYFTVQYTCSDRMKVGVTCGSNTVYYDYTSGESASYTFTNGNGTYTITLFRRVTGTSYTPITSVKVNVKIADKLAPYCASTKEITFSKDDPVGKKAAELCKDLTDDVAKVLAIHNFVASTITYDYDFAASVISGKVKTYVPDTSSILESKKGICYDYAALFAALCRSQDIPCSIEKGYYYGLYHAWNKVYLNDTWYTMDLTMDSSFHVINAAALEDCVITLTADSGYKYAK